MKLLQAAKIIYVDFLGESHSVGWETDASCRDEDFPIQSKVALLIHYRFLEFTQILSTVKSGSWC